MLSELLLTDEGRAQLVAALEAERPPVRPEPHETTTGELRALAQVVTAPAPLAVADVEPSPARRRTARIPVWQDFAACADHPGAMDVTRGPAARAALALCDGCPVITQCTAWLAGEPDYVGVAAGRVISTHTARARAASALV